MFGLVNPASSLASSLFEIRVFVTPGCPGSCCYPTCAEVLVEICFGMSGVPLWWLDFEFSGSMNR